MNIQEAILEQNTHLQKTEKDSNYVDRSILSDIKLGSKFIEVITGVRRSGKSTIFNILIETLKEKGKAKPEEILLVNFDHPSFISYYTSPERLDEIIEQAEILNGAKVKYLFLDEIQNIHMWEKWVKSKYDSGVFKKMFLTGSNADLLSGDYISRLSGRFFSHTNYPFSFAEFLKCRGEEFSSKYSENYPRKYKLVGLFDEYLRMGGFPEVAETGDKDILSQYYETIVLKDVIAGNNIRNHLDLRQVAYYLISNTSKFFSYNKIGQHLDIHENTVKEYIDYLKSAYLFDDLGIYSPSVKKQNRNPRKIYCVDNGLVYATGFQFSLNSGRYLENLVFNELKKKHSACFYHSEDRECDFVAGEKKGSGKIAITEAIQVCYEINSHNKKREVEGLKEAMKKHELKQGLLLTHNTHDEIKDREGRIVLMPVWRWLLENGG